MQHRSRHRASNVHRKYCERKQKWFPTLGTTPPMLIDKAERRPAFVQTTIFEATELKQASDRQHDEADDPAIEAEKDVSRCDRMERHVRNVRDHAKKRPDCEIAGDDQRQQ